MKSIDVFISGAGISGTITAIFLARMGLNVVVADPYLKKSSDFKSSRTTALMNESLDILDKIGLLKPILSNSEDLKQLTIIDESISNLSPIHQTFYANELSQDRFGRNIFVNDLQKSAIKLAHSIKKITFLDDQIKSLNPHEFGVDITTETKENFLAKLIIAADGRNSRVRDLYKISCWQHDYDQMAITGIISHSKLHHNTSTEYHRAGGPLTFVPLPNQQSSFVWMENTKDATHLLSLNKEHFIQELQKRSHHHLGTINLISHLESWPISALKARDYIAPRCALIAETIHVISPIGAQGLNLSLRDIDSLITSIQNALNLGLDIGSQSVLNQYKKSRQIDIESRVGGTDLLNRFVQFRQTPLKQIRRLGLKIAGGFTPLRHKLMQEGLRGSRS